MTMPFWAWALTGVVSVFIGMRLFFTEIDIGDVCFATVLGCLAGPLATFFVACIAIGQVLLSHTNVLRRVLWRRKGPR